MTEAITRSIDVQEVTETREFVGLVAPYDEVITVGGYKERYDRGVFTDAPLVQIYWNHDTNNRGGSTPIGRVIEYRETDAGLEVVAKISATARGDEVYTLLREGVLDSLSAHFVPTAARMDGDVTVYEKAELLEVSVVGRSAYPSAKISEVRSEDTNKTKEVVSEDTAKTIMTEVNYDDSEIRSGLSDLERRLEVLTNREDAPAAVSSIRSYGEYVQGIARGDEDAQALYRAWEGGTSADNVLFPSFVADLTTEVAETRRIFNLFDKGSFPAQGNVFEYIKEKADSLQVGKQVNEGDVLPYGKISFEKAAGSIDTYGGWTSLTRQEIERGNVNVVDRAFRRLATRYAAATESAVKNKILAASPHAVTGSLVDFDGWMDYVIDGSAHLQNIGLSAEFLIVSPDVYKTVAKMREGTDGAYLLSRDNGAVNPKGLTGTVLGIPLVLTPGTGVTIMGHSSAALTLESGGPSQLTDGDITNLTAQLSVYGYMGAAVVNEDALVVVGA